ncbi:MAG: LicD family protein [Fibrobacter sp.]|nr:LicD family protein [Fibrobacter sp.]
MDDVTLMLQQHLLKMMSWFHSFCEKNNIRYFALGGTMLGAARHKGFIPWDDDIDVGIPRPDYERLRSLIGNREYEGYYLETPDSTSFEYRYPYCKLYDTRTTLIEHTWPVLVRGVFIDVFPLDGLGNDEENAVNNWKSIVKLSNFIWMRTCAIRKGRSLIKNVAIACAHLLPKIIARDKEILFKMDKMCLSQNYDSCSVIGNVFGNWGRKEIMPLLVMGRPVLYDFCGIKIYGAENADAYLTYLYGNWRKLPPKEKQVSHHDYLEISLFKSYIS